MSQERISKGKSLIDFPSTYVVIDIETTGRSPKYDEIIELSAIRVSEGVITDQFSSLVQPTPKHDGTYLDNFIVHLTGITDNMLASAPRIIDILPNYIEFLSNDILVGHNINFDI